MFKSWRILCLISKLFWTSFCVVYKTGNNLLLMEDEDNIQCYVFPIASV
jgi:predicted acyltransferase